MSKRYSRGNDRQRNRNNRDRDRDNKNNRNERKHQDDQKHSFSRNDQIDETLPKIEIKVMECAYCHKPIEDLESALPDRKSESPIHFDCALKILSEEEKLLPNEKISYIGQGKFGVIHFENPHDQKHFTIKKTIEWETSIEKANWRQEITDSFSAAFSTSNA